MSFTTGLKCLHVEDAKCSCKGFHQRVSLMTAAEWGMEEEVRARLAGRIKGKSGQELAMFVDKWGYSPLHLASHNGHVGVVRALLQAGANANALDCGASPLHRACYAGALEVVELLLANGADAWVKDRTAGGNGDLPAHKAARRGHLAVVKSLMALAGRELLHTRNADGKDCLALLLEAHAEDEPLVSGEAEVGRIADAQVKASLNVGQCNEVTKSEVLSTSLTAGSSSSCSSVEAAIPVPMVPIQFGVECKCCGERTLCVIRMACCQQMTCRSCYDQSRQRVTVGCSLCVNERQG